MAQKTVSLIVALGIAATMALAATAAEAHTLSMNRAWLETDDFIEEQVSDPTTVFVDGWVEDCNRRDRHVIECDFILEPYDDLYCSDTIRYRLTPAGYIRSSFPYYSDCDY